MKIDSEPRQRQKGPKPPEQVVTEPYIDRPKADDPNYGAVIKDLRFTNIQRLSEWRIRAARLQEEKSDKEEADRLRDEARKYGSLLEREADGDRNIHLTGNS